MTAINESDQILKCRYCIYSDCFIPADRNICLCSNRESDHYAHLLVVGMHGCEKGVPVRVCTSGERTTLEVHDFSLKVLALRSGFDYERECTGIEAIIHRAVNTAIRHITNGLLSQNPVG